MCKRLSEKELLEIIKPCNKNFEDIYLAEGKWSTYDALGSKAIIEMKTRTAKQCQYDDTMLERKKTRRNAEIAMRGGKDYYYVVQNRADGNIYIWNVMTLAKEKYDFNWQKRQCRENNQSFNYIEKEVGGLRWDTAHRVLEGVEV